MADPAPVPTPAPVATPAAAAAAPAAPAKAAWMEPPKEGAKPVEPVGKVPAAVEPVKAADPAVKPAEDPAKPAATEPAKAPEKFTLKAPEGAQMEAAALEKYGAEMKALGLSEEQAQKLLLRDHEAQKASHTAMLAQLDGIDKANVAELQKRWGEKFPEMSEKVKRVFDYADPKGELRKEVEAMKMAHHPRLIEFVERFVPLFEEPSLKAPSAAGVTEKDTRPPQEKLVEKYRKQMSSAAGVVHH